jgi:O-antigen biosynthesis protein
MRRPRILGGAPTAARAPAVPAAILELARAGRSALATSRPPDGTEQLHVAAIIPSFKRGSGGHGTIVRLLQGLRELGHDVSVWLEDCEGWHTRESTNATAANFRDWFATGDLTLHGDFAGWQGADVVLATGWQTVPRVLMLPGAQARAYLVQDHEPDFYPASAQSLWAEQTYRQGLHCIAASAWLAELVRRRYGASASHFDLAPDHRVYAPDGGPRRDDMVIFYARAATPRRAVPLGLGALEELARRHDAVEIALYGEGSPLGVSFPHRQLGMLEGRQLSELYSRATVGVVLSLTNPSLVSLEMMACGLPCVELASESMLATFGTEGPLQLAQLDVTSLTDMIERLLNDPARRLALGQRGVESMAQRTWEGAASQLAGTLRQLHEDARKGGENLPAHR